ncbi:putative plasmid-related protein [Pantoea ananatis PA13]|nr:putative plasmid-related protein [Pantoea ananatis PA13]
MKMEPLPMYSHNLAKTVVLADPNDVESYLQPMNLSQSDLALILERGLSGRYSTTQNHPATSRGQYFYGEGVSAAREILASKGYSRLSLRNVELTVSDKVAIYLCRGCSQTGFVHGYPESRMKKGDFTRELMGLIHNNNPGQGELTLGDSQIKLDLDLPEGDIIPLLPNKIGRDLWFLLYELYDLDEFDRKGIRAELSRPVSYNNKNVVNSFSTRLILDIHQPDPIVRKGDAPQFTPDIDLDILKTG